MYKICEVCGKVLIEGKNPIHFGFGYEVLCIDCRIKLGKKKND